MIDQKWEGFFSSDGGNGQNLVEAVIPI